MVLFAGFFEPGYGLGVVLWNPLAQITHDAQVVLRPGVAFFCGLAEPLGGFLEILIDADAFVEKQAAFVVLIGGGVPGGFYLGFLAVFLVFAWAGFRATGCGCSFAAGRGGCWTEAVSGSAGVGAAGAGGWLMRGGSGSGGRGGGWDNDGWEGDSVWDC